MSTESSPQPQNVNKRASCFLRLVTGLLFVYFIVNIVGNVPWPFLWRTPKDSRARASIARIESALAKMLADSGRSNLGQLLNPVAVQKAIGVTDGAKLTAEQFLAATNIYTVVYYALLRDGNGVLKDDGQLPRMEVKLNDLVDPEAVKRLSYNYMDIGFDPWQNLFNIYPGPWPASNGPVPFRSYFQWSSPAGKPVPEADALTLSKDENGDPILDPDTNEPLVIGYPAPREKIAFIWSNGENLASGQAIYSPEQPYDPAHAIQHYDLKGNGEYITLGGGDDVNNWDQDSSWTRFY